MTKLNDAQLAGRKRPERGPYPKGVANGPDPSTERGRRRRAKNTEGLKLEDAELKLIDFE